MPDGNPVAMDLLWLVLAVSTLVPLAFGLWVFFILRSRRAVGLPATSRREWLKPESRRLDRPASEYTDKTR